MFKDCPFIIDWVFIIRIIKCIKYNTIIYDRLVIKVFYRCFTLGTEIA